MDGRGGVGPTGPQLKAQLPSVLERAGMLHHLPTFLAEEIDDVDTIMMMSNNDLLEIGIPQADTWRLLTELQR